MTFKRTSIRFQLLLWLIVPIITLLLISVGSNYYLSTQFANEAFDDGLEDLTRTMAGRIEFKNGKFTLNSSLISKSIIEYDDVDKNYYLILGPHNQYIAGNRVLGNPEYSRDELSYRNTVVNNEPMRVATIRIPYHNQAQSGFITLQMAETFNGRNELKNQILISTLFHQLVLILLFLISVWIAVLRGLLPLEKIRQAIINRSPNDFTGLNEKETPEEVRPLISAINNLMHRLGGYVSMQQRFVANAAHQLRTPLAGLQTQTELLMREEIPEKLTPYLQQITHGIEHSIRLVNQLLALARNEPNLLEPVPLQIIDFSDITAKVTEAFVPQALSKKIDLGLDIPGLPVRMLGNETSLYEMISNLVDNALTYTQPGGQVTVRVLLDHKIQLIIEDNGPGIPLAERANVFERFYRLPDHQKAGSGLGLSIVSEIVQTHQGTISLQDGPNGHGTAVLLEFPTLNIK